MKKIDSSSVPAGPPTEQINGFRIWEEQCVTGMRITVQSAHNSEHIVQTIMKPNAISFSSLHLRRALFEMLENMES